MTSEKAAMPISWISGMRAARWRKPTRSDVRGEHRQGGRLARRSVESFSEGEVARETVLQR